MNSAKETTKPRKGEENNATIHFKIHDMEKRRNQQQNENPNYHEHADDQRTKEHNHRPSADK